MSSILSIAQPTHEMNYIPGVGRFICIATAIQKVYCAWKNCQNLQQIGNRSEGKDKVLETADKIASKIPGGNKLAKKLISDSSRSVVYNLKPLGENLGWVLLLTACATNSIPGTASIGILFSLYARPWTHEVRGTQWPLVAGGLLWTVMSLKENQLVSDAMRQLL